MELKLVTIMPEPNMPAQFWVIYSTRKILKLLNMIENFINALSNNTDNW